MDQNALVVVKRLVDEVSELEEDRPIGVEDAEARVIGPIEGQVAAAGAEAVRMSQHWQQSYCRPLLLTSFRSAPTGWAPQALHN